MPDNKCYLNELYNEGDGEKNRQKIMKYYFHFVQFLMQNRKANIFSHVFFGVIYLGTHRNPKKKKKYIIFLFFFTKTPLTNIGRIF